LLNAMDDFVCLARAASMAEPSAPLAPYSR
jgi:hypothetical protein